MGFSLMRKLKDNFLTRGVRDVFDANTADDFKRRAQAQVNNNQPVVRQTYQQQQIAQGNKRPYQNFGTAIIGNTARFLNTGEQAKQELLDTARLYGAQLRGDKEDLRSTNQRIKERQQQAYQPNSGFLGAGTIFNSPQEFNTLGAKELTRRVGATTLGTAGEVLPTGRGLTLANQGVRVIPKLAAYGALTNAASDIGNQYISTGKVNPNQVAKSALTGAVLSTAPPLAVAGVKKAVPVVAKGAQKVDEVAFNLPVTRVNLKEQAILRDFSDALVGANKAQGKELSDLITQAQQLGRKYNTDLTNGSIKDRLDRSNAILDSIGKKRPSANVGAIQLGPKPKVELKTNVVKKSLPKVEPKVTSKLDPLESLKQEARKYKSAEEFVKAQAGKTVTPDGYGMSHRPTEGPPAHDLLAKVGGDSFAPKDIYDHPEYYADGGGSLADKESIAALKSIRGNPNKEITIYRASPSSDLNHGDWVTLSKSYAKQESLAEGVKVNAHKVKASDVKWAGDSLNEFGYFPDKTKQLTDLYNQATQSQPPKSTLTVGKPKVVSLETAKEVSVLDPEGFANAVNAGKIEVVQPKPKVALKTPEQIKVAQKETLESIVKPKVTPKTNVNLNRTTDDAIREIAQAMGRDIGEANTKLGPSAQAISAVTGGKFTNTRGLNPFRQVSDATSEAIGRKGEKAITDKGSKIIRTAEGAWAGTGRTADTKQIPRQFEGRLANIGDLVKKANKESTDLLDNTPNSRQRLDLVMRDNAYIKRVYGDGATKQSPNTLTPELKAVYEKYTNANKVVNDINLQTGVIDSTKWLGGTKGQHIARRFEIPKGEKELIRDHVRALFDQSAGVKRKDISKFEDELIALLDKDPIRAIEFRTEMSLRNLAFTEALDAFKARNFIQDTAPNKGFIKLTGKRWGEYDGKFMERTAFEQLSGNRQFLNDMSNSFNNLIETYQRSGLGKLDRIQKAFKTTMNVGTSVGNLLSNPMVFNVGAGTNPVTQLFDMAGAMRQMRKGMSDGDVYLARELGVIGGDTGRILTGSSNRAASAVGDAKVGIARKALNAAGRFYGGMDDVAKLGLFNRLRKKGLDPRKAAQEVAKFTQDYNNVGRTVQLIADMPVMGKPFARFSPELVRIIKNNVTRAPHRMIAGVAGLAYLTNKLSQDAGETDEERRTREEAVGQTMIPGTAWINKQMGGPDRDVSLNLAVKIGDNQSAVNIARTMGLNFPIEPGTDPKAAILEQLIPVENPTRINAIGERVFDPTKIVTSMTLRPLVEQAFDQNFMGKKISDPTNTTYDSEGNVRKLTPPSTKDQLINRGLAFGSSVLPMGYEATSIASSVLGRPGPTGKDRSVLDSVARTFGVKAEKNDPESRAKRTDTANFFEVTKPAQDKFLRENKDLESLYFQVYPKTKDRETGKKISNQIGPEKWAKVNSEKSGRLFEFMKSQALEANKRDGQPVDPIYKLPKDKANELLELRARPTGDDIEREQILRATTEWYPELEKQERDYYGQLSKYFDQLKAKGVDIDSSQHDRVRAYNNIKYPEQPPFLKDYYAMKATDPDKAKAFLKSYDKDWVNSQFDSDAKARLEYINAKRAIEGADPIPWDVYDNVTYGYENDERKVATELYFKGKEEGWGYGGSGSKNPTAAYTKVPQAQALQKVSLKSSTPEIRTKKSVKRRAKPKLQLKKSNV